MTYTKVNLILTENDPALCEEYKDFLTMFRDMEELRGILLKRRQKRGSIDFDLPEAKIILDENGKPKEIKASERNVATSIIEEFMLICNETVAEEYFWQNIPFVYRVHEVPDEEKLKTVYHIIASFGYRLKNKDEIHPKEIQKLLENASKDENERIISRLILRSMKQAKYMAANLGHFGLAAKYYCHFTSPIRRYPDLQIHRIIKENIAGMPEKRINHYEKILEKVSSQSSFRERLAEEAERETDNLKKAEFMLDKIGMEFEGVISGLTKWGIYVELPNTVEGMVALKEMDDDYYYFDEENMVVTGERSKKVYRLGANVKVKVTGASTELRTVDFIFANE